MNGTIKVTVGICIKNAEKMIRKTLTSVLEQDFPHKLMEIIVVDGCSEDRTLSIVNGILSKQKIKHKILQESIGLGFARNLVVENAGGNYIVWVDGDMILAKDCVKKQMEFMERNPDVGIGRGKYGIWSRTGLVAYLENIPFVVESLRHDKSVPLGICGTEGAIYRVKAIRQAGGFDTNIKGAGEDTELAHRIIAAGWLACVTPAIFYEICRETWKALWDEYFWWGRGGHYNFHKRKGLVDLVKMSPLAGFVAGILRLPTAYKLTHRKSIFLLPFHYAFKRTAWCCGFIKAHVDGYGHGCEEDNSFTSGFIDSSS